MNTKIVFSRLMIFCFASVVSGNTFFIAKKYGSNDYHCVTNSSNALSWIIDTTDFVSRYLSEKVYFDCEITNDYRTDKYYIKEPWKLKNSLDEAINNIILDERWEAIPTIPITPVDGHSNLRYTSVLNFTTQDFDIPLSIRTQNEAHIFLCDGWNPSISNCYWLLLQAFQGKVSSIRKCKSGEIPSKNNVPATWPCTYRRVNLTHPPDFLSDMKWSHFVLSKHSQVLTFSEVTDHGTKTILEWKDTEIPIDVKNMILHSKAVTALWKIHQVDFMYSQVESTEVSIGPNIFTKQGFVCVSMYILMCTRCSITLSLVDQKHVINEETFQAVHLGWRKIRFITEKVMIGHTLKLLVSTKGPSESSYWAIDKVRLCQKQDFRVIENKKAAPCQLISENNDVIYFENEPSELQVENNCPKDTIGDFCLPCSAIFESCEQITICSKDRCSCSAGYYSTNCYYVCEDRHYGFTCQNQCEKCETKVFESDCDKINGTCFYGCKESYSGSKCDIPPSVFFVEPPEIMNITYTEASVKIRNFFTENPNNLQPSFYMFQQRVKASGYQWITISREIKFYEAPVFKIQNLEPDTQYVVRAVIVTKDQNLQLGPHLRYSEFTTKCDDVFANNIIITPSNTTVSISFIRASTVTCKYFIKITPGIFSGTTSNEIYITGLVPFTKYEVEIYREKFNYRKEFTTAEGVPARVQNFLTTPTNTSVHLKWTTPRQINGEFQHYIVEYKRVSSLGCSPENQKPSEVTKRITSNSSLTIENLIPYSLYTFSVFARNTKFRGRPSTRHVETFAADDIKSDELPLELNVTTDDFETDLEFSEPNCDKLRGPILKKISTNCISKWCHNQTRIPKTHNLFTSSKITLNDLMPFTNYTVEVKFCRNNGSCDTSRKTNFRTKPSVPGKVQNLIVYTKNSSSISLRWEPPNPPNGILKEYRIDYYYGNQKNKIKIITQITPCRLWPSLHCTTLSNLRKDVYYTIQISARNEEPTDPGKIEIVATQTRTEKPEPPYDLKIKWTPLNNLKLQWKHPNKTNGDVKQFDIEINDRFEEKITKEQLHLTEDTYNLTYYFEINATKFSPTTYYKIIVRTNNGQESKTVEEESISPPEIPNLSKETKLQSSNNSIFVDLYFDNIKGKSDGYKIYTLVSGQETNLSLYKELEGLKFEKMKIISMCNLEPHTLELRIHLGQTQEFSNCTQINNPTLSSGTSYNITIVVINSFQGTSRKNVFSYTQTTKGEAPREIDLNLFGLLALLLVIPLLVVLYLKRHDLIALKNSLFKENNRFTGELDIQDEQISLSQVTDTQIEKQVQTQPPKKSTTPYSKPIKITELEKYIKESIQNGELDRQHALFPRGQTKSWKHGSLKANKPKNRYKNLLAYDHSRVMLNKIAGYPDSDYINANYIDGHKVSKAYIATQGPKVGTLDDFWRMVWQENIRHIANLANIYEGGKKKLEKYWPDINETLQFSSITVQHVSQKVFADYDHRTFTVSHNGESRKLEQLHFTSWPDHGVPLYCRSLVPFLKKLLQIPVSSKSPILVHCSAGVGRTGTILLCDISLRMAAKEGFIDALRTLQLLRDQRPNMVDNNEQYKLAHVVILESLFGLDTSVSCKDMNESVDILLKNGTLRSQIEHLKNTEWQDQTMKTIAQLGKEMMVAHEKNRFKDIIPEIQGRVFISRCPPEDETSSYINAVKIDGFRSPGRFIVTQNPLPNTLGDFWRLIDENTTTAYAVIVSLNTINLKDKTSCHFWPTTTNSVMKPVAHITLKHVNTLPLECYDVITVHLCTETRQDFLQVQIIGLKNWEPKSSRPENIEEFLSFWEQTNSSGRGANPIFVTCYDGCTASGLFVAMSFIIEKMKLEQVCDVCQAVRNVRHNRPQFVQKLEQFEFLYRAAVLYINGFESYANFS